MDSLQPNNILHSFFLPKMTKFFCFEIHRYKVFCTLCANHVFADGFFLFVKVKEISLTDNREQVPAKFCLGIQFEQ